MGGKGGGDGGGGGGGRGLRLTWIELYEKAEGIVEDRL